jgi:hypothetical protein
VRGILFGSGYGPVANQTAKLTYRPASSQSLHFRYFIFSVLKKAVI